MSGKKFSGLDIEAYQLFCCKIFERSEELIKNMSVLKAPSEWRPIKIGDVVSFNFNKESSDDRTRI